MRKRELLQGVMIVGSVALVAYCIMHRYNKKQQKAWDLRETLYFQLI